jgi:large subunit ribosomal protein L29
MNASEIREMTDEELRSQEQELARALLNLRIQYATGQLTNTAQLKLTKRDLARVKTILQERRLHEK